MIVESLAFSKQFSNAATWMPITVTSRRHIEAALLGILRSVTGMHSSHDTHWTAQQVFDDAGMHIHL